MLLFCVRHGQTEFNAQGRIQGQTDAPLSDLGRRQCQAVAEALQSERLEAVYSSPLRRALDGAEQIAAAAGLRVQIDQRLQELNAGVFQGLTWPEVIERFPAEAARWRAHDPDFAIPGGESRRQLMERSRAALEAIRAAGRERVVVVAHGGLLAAAFKALLEIPARLNPFALHNGSISRLQWTQSCQLLSLNEMQHLRGATGSGGDL